MIPVPGDVEKALQELGIEIIDVRESEIIARCPAHFERLGKHDRNPSWNIVREDKIDYDGNITIAGTHNCFSCGFRGPFVGIVKQVLKCTDDEAEDWVRHRGGMARARKVIERRKNSLNVNTYEQVNEASLALYVTPPKWALDQRKLRSWSAKQYGVLWDNKKERWIFPIRDPYTNKLLGWQEKKGSFTSNKPKGLNFKGRTFFGLNVFDARMGILLESPLDAVRMHSVGYQGAVASMGTISDFQLELMLQMADEWLIARDDDSAGIKEAKKIRRYFKGKGVRLRFLDYNYIPGKDIGENSVSDEHIHRAMDNLIPNALAVF